MKRNIKVRGRDGAIRSVNDNYILLRGSYGFRMSVHNRYAWPRSQ